MTTINAASRLVTCSCCITAASKVEVKKALGELAPKVRLGGAGERWVIEVADESIAHAVQKALDKARIGNTARWSGSNRAVFRPGAASGVHDYNDKSSADHY